MWTHIAGSCPEGDRIQRASVPLIPPLPGPDLPPCSAPPHSTLPDPSRLTAPVSSEGCDGTGGKVQAFPLALLAAVKWCTVGGAFTTGIVCFTAVGARAGGVSPEGRAH